MKKLMIFLLLLLFFQIESSSISYSQGWELQAEGLAYGWNVIDAVDSNVAVAHAIEKTSGQPSIYRTIDGGKSWQRFPWFSWGIIDISIIDSLNFWAVTHQAIYHSSDGGKIWELQYSGDDSTTRFFNYIEMFDSLNGIAQGDAPHGGPLLILKTEDGGKNWISQNQSHFINGFCFYTWRPIQFITPDIGYGSFSYNAVPLNTLFLHKTINGGINWFPTSLSAINFITLRFFDENIGIMAWKANMNIYRTTDGGENFTNYLLNFNESWCNDIEFVPADPAKIYAAFGKKLFFSSDTGKTWVELLTPDVMWLWDIKMVDKHHGWIAGERGIIHTSTGGITSVIKEKSVSEKFILYQNYPNPYNSTTDISFYLAQPEIVSFKIFNLAGEEVMTLVNNQHYQAGHHSVKLDASGLSSGIYFYLLTISQDEQVKRMILLK